MRRDIDGIVLGEGFSARVMDAFLTVLTEDARFRNLPVVVASNELAPSYDLPNLESSRAIRHIVATVLPLVRQHAFEAHLSRTLRAIDAEGLIDARTGLLTNAAFERDFATAVYQTHGARRRIVRGALCLRSRHIPAPSSTARGSSAG